MILRHRRRAADSMITRADLMEKITMSPGETLKTVKPIRSQKTGVFLPREGIFIEAIENLGRKLILVNFGPAGKEYLFPDEIVFEPSK